MQLAHRFGEHDLIGGVTYDKSETETINVACATSTFVNRDSTKGYLPGQDPDHGALGRRPGRDLR